MDHRLAPHGPHRGPGPRPTRHVAADVSRARRDLVAMVLFVVGGGEQRRFVAYVLDDDSRG